MSPIRPVSADKISPVWLAPNVLVEYWGPRLSKQLVNGLRVGYRLLGVRMRDGGRLQAFAVPDVPVKVAQSRRPCRVNWLSVS